MPLYTDSGYSYYGGSGGGMYSSYYSTPTYGSSSSSSSPYAPYSSSYNRSYNGTYTLPSTSRSAQYTALISRYQPKLTTITESPLTSRGNFIPLKRIQSPQISTYTPSLCTKYIPSRPTRPKTINTADIDVSASSRYGRHHHMADRKKEDEKVEEVEDVQSTTNTDSDTSSNAVDPNSPFMPRVDGTDTGHHARSTIKRNRAVVRLSMMRSRNKNEVNIDGSPIDSESLDKKEPEVSITPEITPPEKNDPLERFYIHDKAKEEGLQISVTDMVQSQIGETSLSEMIIEVDPITNTVRRLSIPQVPSFHDICEDISSDKIDDDLNAGELRRRASLIQEQEIEILNELQKSQSGSIQVIHLERNLSQEDCRKSRKSKKVKKIRHKITANVDIENRPLTPVLQQTIEEESTTTASPTVPKFTFNIEDIEEHKIFKLPKKRVKSVKTVKKVSESTKDTKPVKTAPADKESVESLKQEEPQPKVATPKPIKKIEKSESSEDFWSQICSRETLYMNKRKKALEKTQAEIDAEKEETPQTPLTPLMPTVLDDQLSPTQSETGKRPEAEMPKKEDHRSTPKKSASDKTLVSEIPKTGDQKSTPKKSASDKTLVTRTDAELSKKEDQQPSTPKKTINKTPALDPISPTPFVTTEVSKTEEQPPSTPKKITAQPIDKDQPVKKITNKSQDSPKSKIAPKLVAKKKSSPKTDAKEETANLESISKPKTKPSASTPPKTTNEESIASPKINSGSGAKSPEKKKTVKSDTATIKQSITNTNAILAAELTEKTDEKNRKEIPEAAKQELQKPLTPSDVIAAASDSKRETDTESGSGKPAATCDKKSGKDIKPTKSSPIKSDATSPFSATPETQSVTLSPPSSAPTDASIEQVATVITTTTKNSPTTPATASSSPTTTESGVLGSGSNNLSKFATISNLAQYLLDVDAELEDYIPSSAEETDSSSNSYSGDGSLSASMKKKNKQLKKKAKEEPPAFDPNKKIKIDPKKKCYVKEELPRYPLVATPRPLWKREKVVYEESSNSSSEETDSDSECTTSDEYEDELSPKDAIIRMSTCSNDSGFDGGTVTSSSKKALDCDVNCHKKCEKLTANLCGVKQKLIVEALACVKRGAQEARDSPCSPLSLNPAYKIEANDDETSYTYLQFQKSGRITAPATTIPRFKKYSVEDFHFLAVLGKGSFGKVLLAELRNTDFYYAVKCLKKDVVLEDDDVECTLIERKVLALGTKHPYLCHLFCTFQTESHLFFVMEYLNGGDLMFHIQESGRFPEDRARFYGAEIISGLKFLHKKGIIYRDLKLDNVLLDFDGHVRIADFGMCKLQIYLDKTADSFCGTPDYMAPEIIKGDKYNQNVDWWSFGVLLYEMLIGQSPFSGCDEDELFWSICNEIPWFPVYITQEATSILKGLLEKDYTRRVGSQYSPAGDICDHIFFKDIDWALLEKRQLAPPFKPQVKHPLDTQYFDRAFTRERVRLTPIDKEILQSMDQEQFQGFSYTNPNATLD